MPALTNHPTLEHIRTLPIGEIAALPAEHLAILQQDASASLKSAKAMAEWIDGAITMRFSERAQTLRRESGKDTGTVRFEDDGVSVDADLPVRRQIIWD